jgi:hypothetical protein
MNVSVSGLYVSPFGVSTKSGEAHLQCGSLLPPWLAKLASPSLFLLLVLGERALSESGVDQLQLAASGSG